MASAMQDEEDDMVLQSEQENIEPRTMQSEEVRMELLTAHKSSSNRTDYDANQSPSDEENLGIESRQFTVEFEETKQHVGSKN